MNGKIVVVTCASNSLGRRAATALAEAGHTVYASMRETAGRNAAQAADVEVHAREQGMNLRALEFDVNSQESVDAGIATVVDAHGRVDVIVHNAGHTAFGPAEAFTPEQLAELHDINVLSTQRVHRAALPFMRRHGRGLLVWISSSSQARGVPPQLATYFAAKAGMDALALEYARELSRWGIETSIIVPGACTGSPNHFIRAGTPADLDRVAEYEAGPYAGLGRQIEQAFGRIVSANVQSGDVACAIAWVVDTPFGQRPFRVHIDPSDDGAAVAFAVIDRVRNEMLHRVGFSDLLKPAVRPPLFRRTITTA